MCLPEIAQVMGQVPSQTGSHSAASVAAYGGTQGVFCLSQVSLGRFQVSTCRSRAGLQPLLKPGWKSTLQAGGAQPSQCKGTGDGILKPVVSRELQAIPFTTWLVPDVVGKWEIKWPHIHRVTCSSPLFCFLFSVPCLPPAYVLEREDMESSGLTHAAAITFCP